MTARIDRVSDLAGAPITNEPGTGGTSVVIDAAAADITRFADPESQGYDGYIWRRSAYATVVDAIRAGAAERVRVTSRDAGAKTLTVTRDLDGAGAIDVSGTTWWISAGVTETIMDQIDARIFDNVAGELVRDINVEMADCRADDARFAGTPWFDVTHSDYGATGDGVTDDTAAVAAALDACVTAGGGVVYFPAGTYDLSTWASGGDSFNAEIKIIGDGLNTILTGPAGSDFISVLNSLDVESVTFSGWNNVFNMDGATGTVERLKIRECKADGCVRFVNWDTPGASAKFTKVEIDRNTLLNVTDKAIAIGLAATGSGWDTLDITKNFIDGGASTTMVVGIQVGFRVTSAVAATQAKWKNVRVSGNTVRRIDGASSEGIGIEVYGEQCDLSTNTVEEVAGDAGGGKLNAAIVAGIAGGTVVGNTCRNISGTVDRNCGIALYGEGTGESSPVLPFCKGVTVTGNSIMFDGVVTNGVAIALVASGSELTITANSAFEVAQFFFNTTAAADHIRSIQISNNVVRNTTASSGALVHLVTDTGAADIQRVLIEGNIWFTDQAANGVLLVGDMSDIIIRGNVFTSTAGSPQTCISLNAGAGAQSNITIQGNILKSWLTGISIVATATAHDEVFIENNPMISVTTPISVSSLTPTNFRRIISEVQNSREQFRADTDFRVSDGEWNGKHLMLGTRRFWCDSSDRLRIKTSVPTSSTDGTIVGTQS